MNDQSPSGSMYSVDNLYSVAVCLVFMAMRCYRGFCWNDVTMATLKVVGRAPEGQGRLYGTSNGRPNSTDNYKNKGHRDTTSR